MKVGKRGWHKKTLWHDEEWARVLRRDPCVYCGAYSHFGTVEHVDPQGPRSPILNGVGACRQCNGERGSVPLIFYLLWRSLYWGVDRADSFNHWNFTMHSERIRERQLLRKQERRRGAVAEPQAPTLRVSIGDRSGC